MKQVTIYTRIAEGGDLQYLNGENINLHHEWQVSRGNIRYEDQLQHAIYLERGEEKVWLISDTWNSPISKVVVIQPVGPGELVLARYTISLPRFMDLRETDVLTGNPQLSPSGESMKYLPAGASAGDSETIFFPNNVVLSGFIERLSKPLESGNLFSLYSHESAQPTL